MGGIYFGGSLPKDIREGFDGLAKHDYGIPTRGKEGGFTRQFWPGTACNPKQPSTSEAVLASRAITKAGTAIRQWLVKLKTGSSDDTTSWDGESVLQSRFLDFSLEDKV